MLDSVDFKKHSILVQAPVREKICEAVNVLVPSGDITLTAIHPTDGMKGSQTFCIPEKLDDASTWAASKNEGGSNIYWAPNYSSKPNAKVKADEVTLARFLWADIDPKVEDFSSYKEARADLMQRLLPRFKKVASAVIDSGNGLQALFRLDQPVDLEDPKNRKIYLATNEEVGELLEGPGTHNADRILRLPGTLNYPNAAKLRKGYPDEPRLSYLLHVSDAEFSLDLTDDYIEPKPTQEESNLAVRFNVFLEGNRSAKERYAGGVYGLSDISGSGRDMSMVAMMKAAGGFSLDEIRKTLENWPHGSTQGRDQGNRYWQRMWDKAGTPPSLQDKFDSQPSTAETKIRYKLRTVAELKAMPPASWRIKGILPKRGLASIYGPSGSGKTFIVLDLGVSISMGGKWFYHKTESCPVVYVALEGSFGITNRLKAWEIYHGKAIPDFFKVVTDHLSLFHDGDIEEFAQVVLAQGASGGVIFIDTLNQSAPEADENTSKDMGRIISRAMQLQELTNTLVVLVHHTGKDTGKGLRGHSSLNAALDAAIEVKNDAKGRVWSLSKSKDGVDGIPSSFRLEVVTLGKDADGDDITSCVVLPDVQAVFRTEPNKPKGQNQIIAIREIQALIQAAPTSPSGQAKINTEAAIAAVAAALLSDPKRKRERAQSAINGLIAADILTQKDGQLWLS